MRRNLDLIAFLLILIILSEILAYAFSDMGYYMNHPNARNYIGRCHPDRGEWFQVMENGERHYRWKVFNFKKYCKEKGWRRAWLVIKTNFWRQG